MPISISLGRADKVSNCHVIYQDPFAYTCMASVMLECLDHLNWKISDRVRACEPEGPIILSSSLMPRVFMAGVPKMYLALLWTEFKGCTLSRPIKYDDLFEKTLPTMIQQWITTNNCFLISNDHENYSNVHTYSEYFLDLFGVCQPLQPSSPGTASDETWKKGTVGPG